MEARRPAFPRSVSGSLTTVLVVGCAVCACLAAEDAPVRLGAEPWPLQDVRLLDGPFRQAQELNRAYLLRLEPDRLLSHVRQNAGLSPKGRPYGGWDRDGSQCIGHHLTALAHMAASTGDPAVRGRVRYVVRELEACQRAAGDGSLYGYAADKAYYARLAQGEVPLVHVSPWYVTHKIMAGLRDAYELCDEQSAREVLVGLADWCVAVTARLTPDQWQAMLDREHGGPHEVLADVYGLTGERKYLELARKFTHRRIYEPLARGDASVLDGLHANTQFPKFIGYERIYQWTGEPPRHAAARGFWENVTAARSWANGGNSQNEFFFPPAEFARQVVDLPGPETCNTYNMLRLTRSLFFAEPSGALMDYYERALFNHVLASQDPESGGFAYHTPMRPGHYRHYSTPFDSFWCCVNTGMESHSKHGEMIYARSGDGFSVNLFIASEARWKERGLTVRQATRFPDEPRTTLVLTLEQPRRLDLRVRWPAWVAPGHLRVALNGRESDVPGKPDGYVTIDREWRSGDRVQVELPMRLRVEMLPHSKDYAAFFCGPILLAAPLGTEALSPTDFMAQNGDQVPRKALSMDDFPALVGEPERAVASLERLSGDTLRFRTGGALRPAEVTLLPMFRLHRQRYAIYWPVHDQQTYAAVRRRREQSRQEAATVEARTIDRVVIGDAASEQAHRLQGERTESGPAPWPYARWRHATGWFAYDLKLQSGSSNAVRCVFWGGDVGRTFDVQVEGQAVGTVTLNAPRPGDFIVRTFPIPTPLATGRAQATVRLEARAGSLAGGLFDLRIVQPEPDPSPALKESKQASAAAQDPGVNGDAKGSAQSQQPVPRKRRILYNLDGDSCMTLKKGSKEATVITDEDLRAIVAEITQPGSQVDTLLVCINAQVTYYPSRIGTMRGVLATEAERRQWPNGEQQRFQNVQALFDAGTDPYALLLTEGRRRGLEVWLTFRMNDAHGNDFLRTAFWRNHPECRLGTGALDFGHEAVREYVFRLIEEAVERYDADGLELDFQRFPTFFQSGSTAERVAHLNRLVERVRTMLDAEGRKRHRRLVLAARVPSNYGRSAPSYDKARDLGCDPAAWARNGWIDCLTVSEFLFVRYDLPIKPWKQLVPNVPIYGGIECAEGPRLDQCLTPEKYRRAARHLWADGADGIYLFNFFTTREHGKDAFEPPFEVLRELGDPARLRAADRP